MVISEKIEELLTVKFEEEAFSDCFIIEINWNPANNKLEVFVDSDSGITFDKCQRLSRYLEQYLDEEEWLGPKYTLEVSSPGISRPLKLKRQYLKNCGRTLEIDLIDEEKKRKGLLKEVKEDYIVLEEEVSRKEGKKKKKEKLEVEIPFDQIQRAIVKVSFKK